MKRIGAIGMTTLLSALGAVAAWALIQVYANLDTRVSSVEAQTAIINNTVVSDHQDIQWIRKAMEDNKITPR